jgi:hypothetical protein
VPPNAERLLILLSDGLPNEQSPPISIAQDIRDSTGFRIIAVGTEGADRAYLERLVENPDEDILVAGDLAGLVKAYGEIAKRYVNVLATGIEVHEDYNSSAFDYVALSARTADTSQDGTVAWKWGFFGDRGRSCGYQLRPRKMGTHKVANQSGSMSLVDCNDQQMTQSLPLGPPVLVLFPSWVFTIVGGVFLVWLIYRFLEEIRMCMVPYGPGAPPPPPSVTASPMAKSSDQRSATRD